MDIVDAARHTVQTDYSYFKVNKEKRGVGVKQLLEIYGIWNNKQKRDVLDFDELYQDLTLKKSIDAYIEKAFSQANSENKVLPPEEISNQIKHSVKEEASGKIDQKSNINHHIQEKNLEQGISHECGKEKIKQNDSCGQNEIPYQLSCSVPKNLDIKSQNNVTSQTTCSSKSKESIDQSPECYLVKNKEKDMQLKNNNDFCMSKENIKSKLIAPMKNDISIKWNTCKQTNSSNKIPCNKTQQFNEKIKKCNFDGSSGRLYGHKCHALGSLSGFQGSSRNLTEQYKQQLVERNKDILCYQNEPLITNKNQTSVGLIPGAQYDWQTTGLLGCQNEENMHFPVARGESDPLWLPYPSESNYFTTTSSTSENTSHMEYQHSPTDYFNWNTSSHLYNYAGENINQPQDVNMYFWDSQSTVTWDLQNYPITSGLDNDVDRRHKLLQHYGGYFEPAEAFLQS